MQHFPKLQSSNLNLLERWDLASMIPKLNTRKNGCSRNKEDKDEMNNKLFVLASTKIENGLYMHLCTSSITSIYVFNFIFYAFINSSFILSLPCG